MALAVQDPRLMKNKARIYQNYVEFGERAASLYLDLAVRFMNDTDLSWFWIEMGMEEKQHAGLLQFCLREHIATRELPDRGARRRLANHFAKLEKRAAVPDLTVDDAFLIAGDLEASEINTIYTRLISPIRGPWYIIRKKIESSVPDHMDGLIEGARRFGLSQSTMAKLADLGGRATRKVV